ncbi:hypothetical protein EVAR_3712_1 [Eumeta japonica]|uniref:Uncharacterized protein n=1 Tax=Eumeta variegata TaxID=151549 RepID=A0A4C1SS93_EUMVA|nr:hypothetical protein EVAR_3712_1 [Eumeta japonica]
MASPCRPRVDGAVERFARTFKGVCKNKQRSRGRSQERVGPKSKLKAGSSSEVTPEHGMETDIGVRNLDSKSPVLAQCGLRASTSGVTENGRSK